MSTILQTTLAAGLAIAIATSAVAAPNDGRFKRSSEAMKLAIQEDCQAAWNFMVDAENRAEKLADQKKIKASKAASQEADDWWSYGVRKGCGWAS
jgi:hypothetical protein